MKALNSVLSSGVLHEYRRKIAETLIYNVDADLHAKTYIGNEGNDMYAEPEFTGKYLDLCMKLYRTYKDERALQNARKVVDSILKNQRTDGYLGCLAEGKEFLNFGVWNQAFTVLGLISYYQGTDDRRALEAAGRSVSYTMDHFMEGKADILDALNGGTQHISILYFICKLYRITKEARYREYILFLVDTIRNSDLNFFEFDDILKLKSRKGIENFIILLGILEYADIFEDKAAVLSVEKYWQQVADTQIRNTGNGTINEFWTKGGGGCMLLGTDVKASETCVAVGWVELSLALFYLKQDPKYLNAVDKTLYNHILASVAEDGSDFAYYQPNYGRKIRSKEAGLYKCCRYRGFTLFTYMDEMLYYEDENTLIPMLYTSNHYYSGDTDATMETDYPFEGNIKILVTVHRAKKLKLRVPKKCSAARLMINGAKQDFRVLEGYIVVTLPKNQAVEVELLLENRFDTEYGVINGREYVAFSYGCLLLAAKGVTPDTVISRDDLAPEKRIPDDGERVAFTIAGIPYCEYAAADDYSVWLPLE